MCLSKKKTIIKKIHKLESINAIHDYMMNLFFLELMRTSATDGNHSSDQLSHQIKQYIQQNFSEQNFKIDAIVEHFNFNYHYLCKVFKQNTNTTIGDYILKMRMKKAKALILAQYTSVETIAMKVGYSNANYFSKRFKKYYGLSPQQYIQLKTIPHNS